MFYTIDPNRDLSLYIHIPFCIKKCDYCAFYSLPNQKEKTIDQFYQVLRNEIEEVVSLRKKPFVTVFIGGGNPGVLGSTRLLEIVRIITSLGRVEEFSIEMNPESLTDDMDILFTHGINRLSIGIQTLNENHLQTLQRSASKDSTFNALRKVNQLKLDYNLNVNVDIMTCIPGQTIEDSIFDIDTIVEIANPDHISLYNLTWEEGTKLTKKKNASLLIPINEEEEREFLIQLWQHLQENGFHQYEISNFAKQKNVICKHNNRYWSLEDYIGIGPSSVGSFHIDNKFIRITGISSVQNYIFSQTKYTEEIISKNAEMIEYLLVRLRVVQGIDKKDFFARFNYSFDDFFSDELQFFKKNMKNEINNTQYSFSLTVSGLLLSDSIISLLTQPLFKTHTPT